MEPCRAVESIILGNQMALGMNTAFPLKSSPALGFPGGAVVKNPPASAGDTGSSPGQGRPHVPRSN